MQYLLLIYEAESQQEARSEEESGAIFQAYMDFNKELRPTGKLLGGDALHPTATATTVRVRDGKAMLTDGPFAETKEQLGGYYLIEAENLDDATAIAAKIPTAKHGSIEVRPVMIFDNADL